MTTPNLDSSNDGASAAQSARTTLHNRYEIDPGAPLDTYATERVGAFVATDRRSPGRKLVALVCDPALPVRLEAMQRLRQASPVGMLNLVESGVILWPPSGRRRLAVIYQRCAGGLVWKAAAAAEQRYVELEMPRLVVSAALRALRGLETLGVTHRAVRPTNLFFADEARTDVVLGDCVTTPPGYAQPAAMETIERAMTTPEGRGEGSLADDLYALGVTLVSMATAGRALTDLNHAQLLEAKATVGSFTALCERQRISSTLLELLRGLLADDPVRRWGLDEVEKWLGGHARALPRGGAIVIAPAPFMFLGRPYASQRLLADAMTTNPAEATAVVRSGDLQDWLVRRASEGAKAREVAALAAEAGDGERVGGDVYLAARVAAILDPAGPIRFGSMRFMRDGLGPALAEAWLGRGDARTPSQVIASGLAEMESTGDAGAKRRVQLRTVATLKQLLAQSGLDGGLERCLYATNPGLACRSPLVEHANILTLDGVLPALEEAARLPDRSDQPMDRHLAAFIAARSEKDLSGALSGLSDRREAHAALATLTLLAGLQQGRGGPAVPMLAEWLTERLDAGVEAYRSKSNRDEIRRVMPAVVRKGRLKELLALVDDRRRRQADKNGAAAAAREMAAADTKIREYRNSAETRRRRSMVNGQQTAATAALTIGFVSAWVALVVQVW